MDNNFSKQAKDKAAEMKARADKISDTLKKKQPKILGEFKDFINRGNVIDLAVGVVVGSAFSKIATSLVNNIIMPFVGLLIGGVDFTGLTITIPNWLGGADAAVIRYGLFLQDVVDFLIIALCIFLVVKLFNKLNRKKDKEDKDDKAAEKKNDEKIVELLESINKKIK